MAKSSGLLALICKAALRGRNFSYALDWDFDAGALTPCNEPVGPSRAGTRHRGICMTITAGGLRPAPSIGYWRTPLLIIVCGCAIGLLSFGPRSSLGFFVQPMSREFSWGRDVFGLALAAQNLLWGLGQPLAGAIADRFGILRVMCVGAVLYGGGLFMMRYATTPLSLDISAGILIGFGLSDSSSKQDLSPVTEAPLPP